MGALELSTCDQWVSKPKFGSNFMAKEYTTEHETPDTTNWFTMGRSPISAITQCFAGEAFDQFRSKVSAAFFFQWLLHHTDHKTLRLNVDHWRHPENPNLSRWSLAQIDPSTSPALLISIHRNAWHQIWVFLRSICRTLQEMPSGQRCGCPSFLKSRHLRRSFTNHLWT